MANSAATENTKITAYISAYSTFKNNRNSLLTTIHGYKGDTNNALILESISGKEYWIIFIKQDTLKSDGAQYYDIDIKGTGLHIIFDSAITTQTIVSACSSSPAASSLVNKIVKLEFYGLSNCMSIESVIQKGTLDETDDISDISAFTKTQFDNLCMGIAFNCTMPLT